jgi:glycerol-3-phosphate acyltransferase PlsY
MEPLPAHPASAAIGPAVVGLIAAFVLGAVPFGVIWSMTIAGIDPRTAGSKNIGFTNVLRVSTRWAAILTLVSDMGKGAAAVWLVRYLTGGAQPGWEFAAALFAVLGDMFTPYLRFKGGKGVATAIGAILAAMPWVGLILVVVWSLVLAVSSYVSLASIVASLALPVAMMLFTSNWLAIACGIGITGMIILRHADNIQRLRTGTEHAIGFKRGS